jgi:cation transport regulator ChaC
MPAQMECCLTGRRRAIPSALSRYQGTWSPPGSVMEKHPIFSFGPQNSGANRYSTALFFANMTGKKTSMP